MIDRNRARELVLEKIRKHDCVIVDEHTIERPFGWVFFYDGRRHVETGDEQGMIGTVSEETLLTL